MSVHLQFTSLGPSAPATTGGSTSTSTESGSGKPTDVFASLLAALTGASTTPATSSDATAPAPDPAAETTAPTGNAAADSATDPKAVLKDFLDALQALQTALDAGQPVDPKLTDRLRHDADALGDTLDGDAGKAKDAVKVVGAVAGLGAALFMPALAPLVSIATNAAGAVVDGVDAASSATNPASGLPAQLGDRLDQLAVELPAADADLAQKLKALGTELSSGKVDAQAIAALGLSPDTADPDVAKAVQALLDSKPGSPRPASITASTTATTVATPTLATPSADVLATPPPPTAEPVGSVEPKFAPSPANATAVKAEEPKRSADPAPAPPAKAEIAAVAPAATSAPTAPPNAPDPSPATTSVAAAAATTPTPNVPDAPRLLPATYQTAQVNLPQLAYELVGQAQAGKSRFQIRLDPPELGRIDVRMDVDSTGQTTARLTVERSETLDLLKRDQQGLERALQQAGLDSGRTNLEFSLRQNSSGQDQRTPLFMPQGASAPAASSEAPLSTLTYSHGTISAGGINLFV